jgi:hypothetical protein
MFPPAVVRSLRNPRLEASAFTPTKFHSAEDKAWFGNAFLKFVADDCPKAAFTERFYNRLSKSFGQIAYFNKHGFYDNFFLDVSGKIDFLEQTLQCPVTASPITPFAMSSSSFNPASWPPISSPSKNPSAPP